MLSFQELALLLLSLTVFFHQQCMLTQTLSIFNSSSSGRFTFSLPICQLRQRISCLLLTLLI
jgi:hypothetical protein